MNEREILLNEIADFFRERVPHLDQATTSLKNYGFASKAILFNMRDIFNHLAIVYNEIKNNDIGKAKREFICAQEHLRRGITEAYEVIAEDKRQELVSELEKFYSLLNLGEEFRAVATDIPDYIKIQEKAEKIEKKHQEAISIKAHSYDEPKFSEMIKVFDWATKQYIILAEKVHTINLKYNYLLHEGELCKLRKSLRKSLSINVLITIFSLLCGTLLTLFWPQIIIGASKIFPISLPSFANINVISFFICLSILAFILFSILSNIRINKFLSDLKKEEDKQKNQNKDS